MAISAIRCKDGDDGEAAGGGFVEDPSKLRRQTEQAERRREKKTESIAQTPRGGSLEG